jgi:hypothetical protein
MHDMSALDNLTITAETAVVLGKVRENREAHVAIMTEARAGHVKAAEAALEERLADVREGKVFDLYFSLTRPEDHTKAYDTAIQMLSMHSGPTVNLNATQVRKLIQDDWSWKENWLRGTAAYSRQAKSLLGDA